MFDPDLIDKNAIAREGIKMLHQSGIVQEQIQRLQDRLVTGDADESVESVAAAVKEFRRLYGMYQTLREVGEQLVNKEIERE
jgi:hypothetical protein